MESSLQTLQSGTRKPKLFAGAKLGRLREGAGMSQAALSRAVGISPSYLNQIERDQRPLPRTVLHRLCDVLGVGIDHFGEGEELRRIQDLREALSDPLFGSSRMDLAELQVTAQATPELGRRLLLLYRTYREQAEQLQTPEGRAVPPMSGSLAPYEEVRDWVQSRHNHSMGSIEPPRFCSTLRVSRRPICERTSRGACPTSTALRSRATASCCPRAPSGGSIAALNACFWPRVQPLKAGFSGWRTLSGSSNIGD